MARTPYSLNSYTGAAPTAVLSSGVTNSSTTIVLSSTTTGWAGLGVSGGFNLALDYGTNSEEKIYVPTGSYSWGSSTVTLSGITRGIDGTSAVAHNAQSAVAFVSTAIDFSEANYLVNQILSNNTIPNNLFVNGTLSASTISGSVVNVNLVVASGLTVNGKTTLSGITTISGLTPGGIVFTSTNGNLIDTGSNGGGATGAAGSLLMSYGNIANGGPEWVNFNVHQTVSAVATSNIVGTYISTGISNSNPNGTVTTGANTTNDVPLNVDVFNVTATGAFVVDGYTVGVGDRILFANQTTQTQNGVWLCTTAGATGVSATFCRDNDADTPPKLSASIWQVVNGTIWASTLWQTNIPTTGTLGTTSIPTTVLFGSGNQNNAGSFLMSYGSVQNGPPQYIQLQIHEAVQVVSTTNIAGTYITTGVSNSNPNGTVTTGANTTNDFPINVDVFNVTATGALTIDGYTVLLGDRILLAGQTTNTQNGIWLCTTQGATGVSATFCRDNDADAPPKLAGSIVQVVLGTANSSTTWQLGMPSTGTLGTTGIPVYQIINSKGGTVNTLTISSNLTVSGTTTLSGTQNFFGTTNLGTSIVSSGIYTNAVISGGVFQNNQVTVNSGNIVLLSGQLSTVSGVAGNALPKTGGTVGALIVSGSLTVSGTTVISGTALNIYSSTIGGSTTSSGQVMAYNGTQWVSSTSTSTSLTGDSDQNIIPNQMYS